MSTHSITQIKGRSTMHIVIATSGTHGDVRPFVALARTLISRGHSVCITGSIDFKSFVEDNNINFLPLQGSIKDLLNMKGVKISGLLNLLKSIPKMSKAGMDLYQDGLKNIWGSVNGESGAPKADIIITHPKCTYAEDSAQALNIPCIMAAFQPLHKTGDFPMIAFGAKNFGSLLNKLSYAPLKIQAYIQLKKRNQIREDLLNLPAISPKVIWKNYVNRETLYAFSQHLQEKPAGWPQNTHIVGFWCLADNSSWVAEARLQDFLDSGDTPIYIGFGSMPVNTIKPIKVILRALSQWGGRAIIVTGESSGWNQENTPLNDNIFLLPSAPHDKLFKLVSGVVHHGGAGSTAAGLKAGKPTLILPHAMDQPYWGRIVHDKNCGPKPIPFSNISESNLSKAFEELTQTPLYEHRAQAIAELFSSENALKSTAEYIEASFLHRKATD